METDLGLSPFSPIHLPSPRILSFLLPISLQCLLLHPIFPASISRPLRFLLIPASVYIGGSAAHSDAFSPREMSCGVNFVLGIMSLYSVWKGIEWGLAADLTPYTWVGFEEDYQVGATKNGTVKRNGHKTELLPKFMSREHLVAARKKSAEEDSPSEILMWTGHLLLSMRGMGWAFGPPKRAVATPFPRTPLAFLRRTLVELFWCHLLLVACAVVIVARPTSRIAVLETLFPSLSFSTSSSLGTAVGGMALGIAAFAGLTVGFQVALLPVFLLQTALRLLPLPPSLTPPPFDSRQYPPLFQQPWLPTSVAVFWNKQWHSFFTRPFKFLAFEPGNKIGKALGGVALGKAIGTMAVFAMSAWLHEHGMWVSTYGLDIPQATPLTFMERWGASIYFLSQGVAIVLEGMFTAVTGRRVKGFFGFLWSLFWTVYLGLYLYISWTKLGLTSQLPEASHWTWQRFVIPLGCLFPPPTWTDLPRLA